MQVSSPNSEADGVPTARRGHISISDPSHHVTEAIGHMYDDDEDQRDTRRLSFLSSPQSETISVSPISRSPTSPRFFEHDHDHDHDHDRDDYTYQPNGQHIHHRQQQQQQQQRHDKDDISASSRSDMLPGKTATAPFPLNNVDYESNPAAVAQELDNLAAIRRMSMDTGASGDPDLPSFDSDAPVPPLPPAPSSDENDASRLFWVPARLHPELAPTEFRSFLESKSEQIKRRSGDFSSMGHGTGGGLQRRASTLSRQIDSPSDYTDGAERLERKRSDSIRNSPNLQDLESLVDGSKKLNQDAASLLQGIQNLGISVDEDRPILPPAPPGSSLRRATRTQYRKGGSKKGEKIALSRRHARISETGGTSSLNQPPITRVSTDLTPNANESQAASRPQRDPEQASADNSADLTSELASGQAELTRDSHISSNEWSTVQAPYSVQQNIPEIVEPPPENTCQIPVGLNQQDQKEDRGPHLSSSSIPAPAQDHSTHEEHDSSNRSSRSHHTGSKEARSTFTGIANTSHLFSGHNARTDSLSNTPTVTEDKKSNSKMESRKSKDKKEDGGSGRKSSWHWLLGGDDKDKEKRKDRDGDSKKHKSKSADKGHDSARLDVLQSSIDGGQRRESLVLDRLDPKLEEERRKDGTRRSSGEPKKEKESGLFSSIFGGGKKKSSNDHHHHHHRSHSHKKNGLRHMSPEPPIRVLQPDIDYAWSRFPILEERAIYRMAHIKLANPRRALHSQVLLSNFMYSYLAKVQQMHPTMMMAAAAAQRQQQQQQQQSPEQSDEHLQYQRYQEMQYNDSSYDDHPTDDYDHDSQNDSYLSTDSTHGYDGGSAYDSEHYGGQSLFGGEAQLDDERGLW